MGLRVGDKSSARFGEVSAGGIEGLELLEKWKEEQGINSENEDEDAGWNNWDAESDESDDGEGWINVESDGEDIDISDSEDEREKKKAKKQAAAADGADGEEAADKASKAQEKENELKLKEEENRISKLATTRILTPADLAKLNELRQTAAITAALPANKRRRIQQQQQAAAERHNDDALTAEQIEGLAGLSHKMTKEEKLRKAKGDPDERNDHRSSTAKRKEQKRAEGKSTTNKEKARKKNFLMTIGKAKRKGKRSLRDEQKIQRGHVSRMKRGGKRGNAG